MKNPNLITALFFAAITAIAVIVS